MLSLHCKVGSEEQRVISGDCEYFGVSMFVSLSQENMETVNAISMWVEAQNYLWDTSL